MKIQMKEKKIYMEFIEWNDNIRGPLKFHDEEVTKFIEDALKRDFKVIVFWENLNTQWLLTKLAPGEYDLIPIV